MKRLLIAFVCLVLLSGWSYLPHARKQHRVTTPPPPVGVEYLSSDTPLPTQTQSNGNILVDIPSNTDIVSVCVSGYGGSGLGLLGNLNFDNGGDNDFTLSNREQWSGDGTCVECYHMTTNDTDWPGTGSSTIYYASVGNYEEGYQIGVHYWRGAVQNDATVIGSTDSHPQNEGPSWTSSLTGVSADDMGVVACYAVASSIDVDPSGSGQTVIVESPSFNGAGFSVGYESGESALEVAGGSNRICVAFSIEAAI